MPPKKQSVSQKPVSPQPKTRSASSKAQQSEKRIPPRTASKAAKQAPQPEPKKKLKGSKKQPDKKLPAELSQKPSGIAKQQEPGASDKKDQGLKGTSQGSKEEKGRKKQAGEEGGEQLKQEKLKKLILKGAVPVDQYFSRGGCFKVLADKERIYAATLNQCNIEKNNNKFYIIQVLQNESEPNELVVFTRWGRVGVQGQKSEEKAKSLQAALKEFHKKLHDKSKTYTLVEMNYEENAAVEEAAGGEKGDKGEKEQPQSRLEPAVQELIRLIFDMKMMASQMKEIGYDAKKMPLGKLAKASILKGYEILKSLMEQIRKPDKDDAEISRLSGCFYSEIPHDFGFVRMANFVLDREQKVKAKLEMLQSLEEIQVFTKLLDQGSISNVNELDSNYLKLDTTIAPLDKNSQTYKLLLDYVENTHASTHTAYKLEVSEIYELSKQAENSRYRKDIDNKQLLWHGSRLTNFVGILSQGLRIAPPQAPVTGYMFGKGVYFADMVTKSANYCFASRQNNTGLMLLCEVALGEPNQKFYADYYANLLPHGKHSTKGCGKTAPAGCERLGDVLVPCKEAISTGLTNTSLQYNEYIVYDIAQIKSRFLFKMQFDFK